MKLELRRPELSRFSIADHVEFHKTSYGICDRFQEIIDTPNLTSNYNSKFEQESYIYKWIRKSEFTKKKAEADHDRDQTFSGMAGYVRSQTKHFDPSIRDNAYHVLNLLKNYGDLTKADYDAETAGIDSVVSRLNSQDYILAVQALGLTSWIAELASLNALFRSYVDDVAQEQLHKPSITFNQARRETDGAYHDITDRVTALININGQDSYVTLVDELNVLTNHYNTLVHEHYGRIHARTDITPADIASIAAQQYTGKPLYVIPAVSIRKTEKDGSETVVELVFSEDYTVSYKNNVEPGTATLYIKGIGKYVGELTTTFNIVHEV
ncbi:MAG: DUF6261 family protein [Prevotellaceae bacterium]|jgi:hypothetical protein|nr:DUF6261 family protein [Prevotellaceae bacterium]